jgi:hypothetical protein
MRPVTVKESILSRSQIYFCAALVMLTGLCATSSGQTQTARGPKVFVHLSVPNRAFRAGDVIHVQLRVSNKGDEPILVANAVSMARGGVSRIELKLTDVRGKVSPSLEMIADYAPVTLSDNNAASKLLGSFVLLRPRTSLLFDFTIDKDVFEFLGKPGNYKLSATYASNGISYGHDVLGLSEAVLKALPYPSWSGKMSTNEVFLNIVSASKPKK